MSDVSKLVEAFRAVGQHEGVTISCDGDHAAETWNALCRQIEALSAFTTGHAEEREKGFREGIEAAAKVLDGAIDAQIGTSKVRIALAYLRNAIRALSPAPWRDIASAPKDGTRFLAIGPDFGGVRVVAYGKTSHLPWEGFCLADQGAEEFDLCTPAHWLPLPEAPPTKDSAGDGGEG